MAAQLAGWVDDAAAQEDAYLRLMDLQPKNEVAMAQWIGVLTRRAQYEDAIEVANSRFPDLATAPRVAVAVATALVAANRFDDALKVLDACAVASMSHADLSPKIIALRQRAMPLFGRWTAEQAVRADEESKAQNARVQFTTSKGTILIELFEQQAPATSLSFVELVENRTYDGTRFHRRLPGFAVLGGDVNTKVGATSRPGFGTIGWRIPDEGKRSDRREAFGGTIGLCKAVDTSPSSPPNGAFVPKSAGSQFFFLLQPAEFLHDDAANFTIFGRIIDGWETVAALGPGDELIAATVVRKGAHEYKSVREPELPKPMEMSVPTQALRAPQPTGVPGQPRPITPR